jgi:hypothetical protein
MDPRELARQFGGRLAFHGSIDTQQTLPFGTPDDVRREVRERIETFKPYGGFTIAPAQHLMPEIPTENIVAMYDAAWEYGWLEQQNAGDEELSKARLPARRAGADAEPGAPGCPSPNIILTMADDQGWTDTGYNDRRVLKTPCLDEMSRAGGHLALLAGYTPHGKEDAVQAVIGVSGPTDLRNWRMQPKAEDNLRTATGKTTATLLSGFPETPDRTAPILREASPLTHVKPGLPATLIFQWQDEQAVPADQAEALARALLKAGVRHELVWIPGHGHALSPSGVESVVRESPRFLRSL